MYKNSLILRITMTSKPFAYKKVFTNLKTNFMFHEDLVKILPNLINKRGIINVGGKGQSVYSFAKKFNSKVKGIKVNKKVKLPLNQTMNLSLLKKNYQKITGSGKWDRTTDLGLMIPAL